VIQEKFMRKNEISGEELSQMFFAGAASLSNHASKVDALNVFPVPDGDTGTNMNLTMTSGISELKKQSSHHAGKVSQSLAKGLLMGARGNSGVILSQLFRGFSKAVAEDESVTAEKLALALSQGVTMAYEAVMKPVEGTILTVAKDAAVGAMQAVRQTNDIVQVMKIVLDTAEQSLARTPELLPILKEVGVVDSGGQGLVYIYTGFYQALLGNMPETSPHETMTPEQFQEDRAQIHLKTEDIEFGYCTEFIVKRNMAIPFHQGSFREKMSQFGDSLLVVADDEWVKIHIHSEHPGEVLNFGQKFGELIGIKIENMRDQHAHIVSEDLDKAGNSAEELSESPILPFGIVAVGMGDGISDILKSLGANQIVEGGQSMNPSTEDLIQAAQQLQAEHIIFLPNNKNIILAAEQAGKILGTPATVIPTRSIPQGMAALLAFQLEESAETNKQLMIDAISAVKSGQVTYAVRDTKLEQLDIREGDFLGLFEGEIIVSGQAAMEVGKELLSRMIDENTEIITILYGEGITETESEEFLNELQEAYPEIEIELHRGGQPLYAFIFSVE